MADIIRSDGTVIESAQIVGSGQVYSDVHSYQDVGVDLQLGAAAGKTGDTAFLAPIMGNVIGDALAKLGNYIGGLIGMLSVTGTRASTYPVGGVLGIIGDTVTHADGAVVAVLDGDSGQTNASAMYGVKCNNSTAASGTDFGLDLQSAAHDGYIPVNAAFYKKAPLRLVSDVVCLVGAGAPTNATTGAAVAGPGSLYIDTTGTKLYINTNTKASPTWTVVGSQS